MTCVTIPRFFVFNNQLSQSLAQELKMARDLGIVPISINDRQFDTLISEGRVKWAVNLNRKLLFIPEFVNGQEIYHTVLSQGEPILAAGLADIVGNNGEYLLLWLSNYSGHYQPTATSLEFAKTVFQEMGINISYADLEIIN